MKTTRLLAAVLVSGAALLGLTACAVGGPTFDFSPQQIEPAKSLTITVTDDLREAVTGKDHQLVVQSYEITGRTIPGAELCAFDAKINYTDGVLDLLKKDIVIPTDEELTAQAHQVLIDAMGVSSWETAAEEFIAASEKLAREAHERYTAYYAQSAEEIRAEEGTDHYLYERAAERSTFSLEQYLKISTRAATVEEFAARRYTGDPWLAVPDSDSSPHLGITVKNEGQVGNDIRNIFLVRQTVTDGSMQQHLDVTDEFIGERLKETQTTPARVLASWMELSGDAQSLEKFDEKKPEKGFYMADDFSKFTRVVDCAVVPQDSENYTELAMTISDNEYSKYRVSQFATARVMVMKDGTVWAIGEVDGFVQDSNGNWVKN